jgi:peptide/nickel transport system substrate-binding protein
MRRFILFALVLATVTTLLSGAAIAQDEKVLIIGESFNIDYMDPGRSFSFTPFQIFLGVYQTLLKFPANDITPLEFAVATGHEISEDALTYTFTLRDDITFSDGSGLTSDDVAFSLMRFKHLKGYGSSLAVSLASVDTPDDYTAVIHLSQPDPAFLNKLTFGGMSILNADVVRAAGGTDAENASEVDDLDEWFQNNSVGSGPYVLSQYEPEVIVELSRNENYWGDTLPYFDRIIMTHIAEVSARKIALEAGDIHIARELLPANITDLEGAEGIETIQTASVQMNYLAMNRDPEVGGPMSDERVNAAVRYALDYDGIKLLNSPSAYTPGSVIPVGIEAAWDPSRALSQDLDLARSLLAEAGYPDGFDATLTYWDDAIGGVEFGVMAQKIAADLAEVGINLTLAPTDFSNWIDPYRAGELQFTVALWLPDFADPSNYLSFVPAYEGSLNVSNRVNWSEANADPLILELRNAADVESDPMTRADLYDQIQQFWQDRGPWVPYLQSTQQTAYVSGLEGSVMHPFWGLVYVTELSMAE